MRHYQTEGGTVIFLGRLLPNPRPRAPNPRLFCSEGIPCGLSRQKLALISTVRIFLPEGETDRLTGNAVLDKRDIPVREPRNRSVGRRPSRTLYNFEQSSIWISPNI
jgi:hypothetical protein